MGAGSVMFEPFQPEHGLGFVAQSAQMAEAFGVCDWNADQWEQRRAAAAASWSAMLDGRCIGLGFVWVRWPGRAEAGLLLGAGVVGSLMVPVHRKTTAVLAETARLHSLRRIETTVRQGFEAGHRWANMLGFTAEGILRRYAPDGSDYVMYALLPRS